MDLRMAPVPWPFLQLLNPRESRAWPTATPPEAATIRFIQWNKCVAPMASMRSPSGVGSASEASPGLFLEGASPPRYAVLDPGVASPVPANSESFG